jgi:antitoxin MazE
MRVFEWDDSLAVELHQELIDKLGLRQGDELRIVDVVERTLIVEKEDPRKAGLAT